jgi:DNA-binding NarL/FixJ family response regulator
MEKASKIRVMLVDDHQVVREGLRRIVQMDEQIEVVGEAKSGEEAIVKAISLIPDVIVMDLKMPGMDGITATREIKQKLPDVNILVLTLYAEDFIKQAIEAGASGYLLKDSDTEQITSAIHQVYDGLSPIALSITRDLVMEFAKISKSNRSYILTQRQVEVLRLISEGVNSREIGEKLFISPSTVKREIRHIFDKLGVSDRSHAVSQAIKRQLI